MNQDKFFAKLDEVSFLGKYPGKRDKKDLLKKGLVLIDKPKNIKSLEVLEKIKEKLKVKKAAHIGTLDPNVTGLLPILLNKGCKALELMQKSKKTYIGTLHLHKKVGNNRLKKCINEFTGPIIQKPPKKSSVKRKKRKRTIYEMKIENINKRDVKLKINCESGTYIRKLFSDMGKFLGVGAQMTDLRRLKVGEMNVKDAQKINVDLKILPVEYILNSCKNIIVKNSAVNSLTNGAPLFVQGIAKIQKNIKKDDKVALITARGELIATAKAKANAKKMYKKKKGKAAQLINVIMEKNKYPNKK